MSKDFFDIMEKIERIARDIKFLENTHPEISNEFIQPATEAHKVIFKLEEDLKYNLRKIHTKSVNPKKKKKNIPAQYPILFYKKPQLNKPANQSRTCSGEFRKFPQWYLCKD